LLTLTDGKAQMTRWKYDAEGRVTNKVDAASADMFRYQSKPRSEKSKWTSPRQQLDSTDSDMKSNGTTTILNWALAVVVVALAIFAVQYYFKTREVRSLQTMMATYQNRQAILNNLIAECLEYSKRNPAIDPILEANHLKGQTAPAGTKPPAK
jgi:YD repeat-containing protein